VTDEVGKFGLKLKIINEVGKVIRNWKVKLI